ncbi:hypothetical protein ACOSQ2_011725 [Xanthoceras sorbifolium]
MRYVKPLQLYQDFMQVWIQSEAIVCPALVALHVDKKYQMNYNFLYVGDCSILLLFLFYSFNFRVLGLVVAHHDIKLVDTHDGGHPENFINDMRKTEKFNSLKYTYKRIGHPYQMSLYPVSSVPIIELTPTSPQTFRRRKHEFWMKHFPHLELQEINVLGLVIVHPNIKLVDTHGGHPKNFIDNILKTEKVNGLKYTYWNMTFMPKFIVLTICEELEQEDWPPLSNEFVPSVICSNHEINDGISTNLS